MISVFHIFFLVTDEETGWYDGQVHTSRES